MQCFQFASPQAARERQSEKGFLPGVAHGEKPLEFAVGVRHRLLSKTGKTRHLFHRIVELQLGEKVVQDDPVRVERSAGSKASWFSPGEDSRDVLRRDL